MRGWYCAGCMEIVHTASVDASIGTFRFASTAAGLADLELPHASGRGFDDNVREALTITLGAGDGAMEGRRARGRDQALR